MQNFKNERVRQAVNYLRAMGYIANAKDLAIKMNRSRSALSEIMSGARPVSDKFLYELLQMFPELNKDFFYEESCTEMLKEGAEGAAIAAGIINSVQGRPNSGANPDLQALVESYAATIRYLQEHIKELSAIITNLTKAR